MQDDHGGGGPRSVGSGGPGGPIGPRKQPCSNQQQHRKLKLS